MRPDWARWLRFAVFTLGLSPEAFWALTVAEWKALTAERNAPEPLGRSELETLLQAHPELSKSESHE